MRFIYTGPFSLSFNKAKVLSDQPNGNVLEVNYRARPCPDCRCRSELRPQCRRSVRNNIFHARRVEPEEQRTKIEGRRHLTQRNKQKTWTLSKSLVCLIQIQFNLMIIEHMQWRRDKGLYLRSKIIQSTLEQDFSIIWINSMEIILQ